MAYTRGVPDPPEVGRTRVMTNLPEQEEELFRTATGDDWVMPPASGDSLDESDEPDPVKKVPPVADVPAPVAVPVVKVAAVSRPALIDRHMAGKLRARRVRRLVRHIEPWSVLKMSLIFYFCLWGIILIAGVILWSLAVGSGTIDNIENFIQKLFALDSFAFNADQIFRASAVGGLVLVVAGAGFTVLMAVLFNLISDVTGGIRLTVVEEETARPRPKRLRPRPGLLRRSVAQGNEPTAAPAQPEAETPLPAASTSSIPMPGDFVGDDDPEVATTTDDR